jgi:hypothetical protein
MITHEEIIKELEEFFHLYGSNEVLRKFRKYVLEQQAKDKRLEKVEELLGLYREKCQLLLDDVYVARPYIEIDKRIIELEKELEDMK